MTFLQGLEWHGLQCLRSRALLVETLLCSKVTDFATMAFEASSKNSLPCGIRKWENQVQEPGSMTQVTCW